jgi:RNA polymerase sigma-70 factor (ECF subfamily)
MSTPTEMGAEKKMDEAARGRSLRGTLPVGWMVTGDEILARFSRRLAGLVRSRLGWKLRRKLDTEDVVQSVFKSFVRFQQDRELSFDSEDALWGLLALITVRKCGHKVEHFMAACRNVAAEQSVAPGGNHPADDDTRRCLEALSREPDPAQAAILAETLTSLLVRFDDRDQRIVTLALEGATVAEISREVERSERTVQRVLKRLWNELSAEPHAAT